MIIIDTFALIVILIVYIFIYIYIFTHVKCLYEYTNSKASLSRY